MRGYLDSKFDFSVFLTIALILISSALDSYSKSFFYSITEFKHEFYILFIHFLIFLIISFSLKCRKEIQYYSFIFLMFWDFFWLRMFQNEYTLDFSNVYLKFIIVFGIYILPIYILIKYKFYDFFYKAILVVLISICITSLISIFKVKHNSNEIRNKKIEYNQKINTYFLIFDEYGSDEQIKKEFEYENDLKYKIDSYCIQHQKIKSEYPATIKVLSSFFTNSKIKNTNESFSYYLSLIYNNKFTQSLLNNEIDVQNSSIFDFKYVSNLSKNSLDISFRRSVLISNIFSVWILNKFNNGQIYSNIKNKFIENPKTLLLNHIDDTTKNNFFYYSHFIIPHEPYVFDSIGNIRNDQIVSNNGYIQNVKYANKIILEILNTFKKSSKKSNTRILIFGDHKFRGGKNKKRVYNDEFNRTNYVQFLYYTPSYYKLDSNIEYSLNEAIYEILKH
jgi:hypothetical protein